MAGYLFDQKKAIGDLRRYFKKNKASLTSFGSTVNQTFEAYVFSQVVKWYQERDYSVEIVNPSVDGKEVFRLKFSTRGAPQRYSFVRLKLQERVVQVRHQLRVETKSYLTSQKHKANICCDIAIIQDCDLSLFTSDDPIPNQWLISFSEVKHMSAFAELMASFIGLVFEMKPEKLRRIRRRNQIHSDPPPFLYVSGLMNPSAKGIQESVRRRRYDIDFYSFENPLLK